MIENEDLLKKLQKRYKFNYRFFDITDTVYIDTKIDEWQIQYIPGKYKPYRLLHKNRTKNQSKFHTQRYLKKFSHAIDSIIRHKHGRNILSNRECICR